MRGLKIAAVLGLGLLLAGSLAAQLTEDDGLLPVADEQSAEPAAGDQSAEPVATADEGSGEQAADPQVATESSTGSDRATGELESASAPAKGEADTMEHLPKTASPLGLLALIGAGGLGTGALLRGRRRG